MGPALLIAISRENGDAMHKITAISRPAYSVYAMVSVMFVLLTVGGAPVGLVLVFAATRSEMALRSVFV